jgi:hypothetical protein
MNYTNKDIIHIKKKDIEYLQFRKLLNYNIPHAYVLKSYDRDYRFINNNYQEVINSYTVIFKNLELDITNLIRGKQIHSDIIEVIDEKKEFESWAGDSLITNKSDYVLATINADCILFLLYDPVKNVIANVHSGWRGSLKRIVIKTVNKMQEKYDSKPNDIICCICPSIRKCHFEVDRDVYELYRQEFTDIKLDNFISFKNNKWYIDTVGINKVLLENSGLKKDNIIDSNICSVCNSNYVNSYRVQGKGTKEGTAIISLGNKKTSTLACSLKD